MMLWLAGVPAGYIKDRATSFQKWRAEMTPVYTEPDYDFVKDPSVYVTKEGEFYMFYTGSASGFQGESPPPWRIDYATSPDGLKWTKQGTAFTADDETWERGRVQAPARPIWHNGSYYLFFAGGPRTPENVCRIGYATSKDLRNWTKHTEPVVSHVNRTNKANDPFVYQERDTFYLFYTTYPEDHEEIYYCISSDLDKWSEPMKTGAYGEGSVVWKEGDTYFLIAAVGYSGKGETYRLFSAKNLQAFRARGPLKMEIPPFASDAWGHGDVIWHQEQYRLYFQGTNTSGKTFQVGLAYLEIEPYSACLSRKAAADFGLYVKNRKNRIR